MGIASIILGVLSFLFMVGAFVFSGGSVLAATTTAGKPIAIVVTLIAFLAPLLGVAGIVTGGIGLSRANREGQPTGLSIAGLIISVLAFIPSILVALTCGLCNACMTASTVDPNRGFRVYTDGGMGQPHDPFSVPDDGGPGQLDADADAAPGPNAAPADPSGAPADPSVPPPAFPPPPMDGPEPTGDSPEPE